MQLRLFYLVLTILIVGSGVSTAVLFVEGHVALGVLGCVVFAGLIGWTAAVARRRRASDPTARPAGFPRSASAPPDGHLRFTLVVDGLDSDRVAQVWADLCRPGTETSEELRLLFSNFTVVEGRRFRFLKGDPTSTAALLRKVLGAASGVSVQTTLEPAAERTAPWS